MQADQTEQTQPETPSQAPNTETVSLADHEAQFSGGGSRASLPAGDEEPTPPAEADETAEQKSHHSAEQKREKDTGKFAEGKRRHRAASQQAGPEDVPRIRELTARAKGAEERLAAAEAELARLKSQHASPAKIAQAEARVDAAAAVSGFREPEPQEDDPQFGGDYGKYLRALAKWEGRKAYHEEKAQERAEAEKARRAESERSTIQSFGQRVNAAKDRYDDFEAVAFGPTRIPEGSPVDLFIMEDEHGPDVLYHLNKHPEELSEILGMTALKQVKALSLLSQRFSDDSTPEAAGTTGAAPERHLIVLPPKPPTPVRTEAQRASDGPPTDRELSLSEHEKYFGRRKAR